MSALSVDYALSLLGKYPEHMKTLREAVEHAEQRSGEAFCLEHEWLDFLINLYRLVSFIIIGGAGVSFRLRMGVHYLLELCRAVDKILKQMR